MINTTLLQILVDQLRQLTKETKEMNQKIENQFDSIEDPMSEDELECLQEQFEDADLYDPKEDCSHASDELAVPTEPVLQLTNNHNAKIFSAECTPRPVVPLSPTDLALICSAFAPSVQYAADSCAIECDQCVRVNELTLLAGFAPHATAQSLENVAGYKLWRPGLRSG